MLTCFKGLKEFRMLSAPIVNGSPIGKCNAHNVQCNSVQKVHHLNLFV